jgi:hypothetical protein
MGGGRRRMNWFDEWLDEYTKRYMEEYNSATALTEYNPLNIDLQKATAMQRLASLGAPLLGGFQLASAPIVAAGTSLLSYPAKELSRNVGAQPQTQQKVSDWTALAANMVSPDASDIGRYAAYGVGAILPATEQAARYAGSSPFSPLWTRGRTIKSKDPWWGAIHNVSTSNYQLSDRLNGVMREFGNSTQYIHPRDSVYTGLHVNEAIDNWQSYADDIIMKSGHKIDPDDFGNWKIHVFNDPSAPAAAANLDERRLSLNVHRSQEHMRQLYNTFAGAPQPQVHERGHRVQANVRELFEHEGQHVYSKNMPAVPAYTDAGSPAIADPYRMMQITLNKFGYPAAERISSLAKAEGRSKKEVLKDLLSHLPKDPGGTAIYDLADNYIPTKHGSYQQYKDKFNMHFMDDEGIKEMYSSLAFELERIRAVSRYIAETPASEKALKKRIINAMIADDYYSELRKIEDEFGGGFNSYITLNFGPEGFGTHKLTGRSQYFGAPFNNESFSRATEMAANVPQEQLNVMHPFLPGRMKTVDIRGEKVRDVDFSSTTHPFAALYQNYLDWLELNRDPITRQVTPRRAILPTPGIFEREEVLARRMPLSLLDIQPDPGRQVDFTKLKYPQQWTDVLPLAHPYTPYSKGAIDEDTLDTILHDMGYLARGGERREVAHAKYASKTGLQKAGEMEMFEDIKSGPLLRPYNAEPTVSDADLENYVHNTLTEELGTGSAVDRFIRSSSVKNDLKTEIAAINIRADISILQKQELIRRLIESKMNEFNYRHGIIP